jgi:hypothetical protein
MMLAEELGMRPLAARCHLGLGQLYRRTGFRRQGEECVFHAKELLGDMGMAFWLETAERELRELRKC